MGMRCGAVRIVKGYRGLVMWGVELGLVAGDGERELRGVAEELEGVDVEVIGARSMGHIGGRGGLLQDQELVIAPSIISSQLLGVIGDTMPRAKELEDIGNGDKEAFLNNVCELIEERTECYLSYQNDEFYLRKAQRIKPTLYDGAVISKTHVAMLVIDDEEQIIAGTQAFWFHTFNPTIEPSYSPPVIMDVPNELPKVSLVNASLKKLKFHLTQFDSVVKKRTTPSALEEEYFEINDLKARLQDKDTTISKLKDTIKSLKKNTKEKNVNHDKCDLEPINEELENSVAKLLSENERLCNEINHVKHVFKDQFDSIKQTRVRHKEQCDSLINKQNLKSIENEDLKAQIQDTVFVITSLKNVLQKSKWKEIVENVVHIPSATTIAPGMFKLDLLPLPPRLLQNREVHIAYLRNTQEQANILWEIVKQVKAKQPFMLAIRPCFCKYATKNFRSCLYMLMIRALMRITPSTKKVAVTPMNKCQES
ncbi:hypothetical protein Tco_1227015 [Tanacetum coccineum]